MLENHYKLKEKKVLIVCFDAGGAEVISSWINLNKYNNFDYFLKGPSIKIFKSKITIKNKKKIIFKNYDLIITGTSLNSNHETDVIKKSKKLNIPVITFMDHWVNYKKRFLRKKKYFLPNIFIVMDVYAKKIAKKSFTNKKVILIEDFRKKYFEIYYKKYKNKVNNNEYLYFSSNYDLIKKNLDLQILKRFLILLKIKKIKNYKIFIKNHPSEKDNKYDHIIDNELFFKDKSKNLYECISKYNNFFASESMALVYARYGNKNIFNLQTKKLGKIPKGMLRQNFKK